MEDLDVLVIQGPSLSWHVDEFWRDTILALRSNGTRVALLGIAFYRFDGVELEAARRFLDIAEPVLVSTRDSRSHSLLEGLDAGNGLYDGIDSAFWVRQAFEPPRLSGGPYLSLAFDRYSEPSLSPRGHNGLSVDLPNGELVRLKQSRLQDAIARRGKAAAYLGWLLDRGSEIDSMAGYQIIRPEHRSNPPMHWKAYRSPNGLMSDEPWSYLTAYAASEVTLSDRVHACAAALAFGRSAMLFNGSPRGALLDRLVGPEIRRRPVRLEREVLEDEQAKQESHLRKYLSDMTS
jgi:polysaccharide pyruvyl transferase WcaK-like protein